ncbi:hypothetical protein GL50803_006048 [Giardia duodenalis]|uniref:Uncharacterized protein n=1 Tax=Giardia intestinalis (strain ATCC 50803 / WB clone C6) TaxID=184922 RepID=A8BEN9_GIAIC|nr:hypothetical protein GL50803_006048 [Giardia intestinalis]KAE8305761.1 hypothetical protein GL50803_006048 [Giardia intestinalis]|eukprot:XP_001707395.1 Hypothetical protein GL50803_6048 [Giardia lamblia ATCC 50803]
MDRENIQALRQYRKFADLTDRDLQILNWDTRSQLLATLMDGIAPSCKLCRLYYSCSQTILPRRHQAERGVFTYEDYMETMSRGILVELRKLNYSLEHISPEMVRSGSTEAFNEIVQILLRHYNPNMEPPPEATSKRPKRPQAETVHPHDHIFSGAAYEANGEAESCNNPGLDAPDAVEEELQEPKQRPSERRLGRQKSTQSRQGTASSFGRPVSSASGGKKLTALTQQFEAVTRAIMLDLPTEFKNCLQHLPLPYDLSQEEIEGRRLMYVSARRLCMLKAQIACLEVSLQSYKKGLTEHRERMDNVLSATDNLEAACRKALREAGTNGSLTNDLTVVLNSCRHLRDTAEPETLDVDFSLIKRQQSLPAVQELEEQVVRLSADVRAMIEPVRTLFTKDFGLELSPQKANLYEQFHSALTLLEYTTVRLIGERSNVATIDDTLAKK